MGDSKPATRIGKLPGMIGRLALWGQTPPGLLPWEQEQGFYLKLHGSLDWLYCPNPACANNANIFSLSASAASAAGQRAGAPCRLCGSALRMMIVPPVATKRMEDRGRLAFLWNVALRELLAADRIVIVGLSFAPSDFELKWLLRAALIGRTSSLTIALVNPSDEARQAGRSIIPRGAFTIAEFSSLTAFVSGAPEA